MLPLILPDWLQRMSLKHPYNVVSVPAPLMVSTIYHAVLQCFDVYNSIRDTA